MNTITAYVYVFNTRDTFQGKSFTGKYDAKRGANLGITYEEGETVLRVVCAEEARWMTDDYSWQDHNLPKDLRKALNLDEDEDPLNAPGFFPAQLLERIAKEGEVILTPVRAGGNVQIRLLACPEQTKEFAKVVETAEQTVVNF